MTKMKLSLRMKTIISTSEWVQWGVQETILIKLCFQQKFLIYCM